MANRSCWAGCVVSVYMAIMHVVFGDLFDSAIFIQFRRTLGVRASPGSTYSLWVALEALSSRYWIFPTTILYLLGGSLLTLIRCFRLFTQKQRNVEDIFVVSWSASGVFFALAISLKSPHYMILWLVPLYSDHCHGPPVDSRVEHTHGLHRDQTYQMM